MKGFVFTEFIEFVEGQLGWERAEEMLERADLAHGGSYTAVGTYPHEEMLALVGALAELEQAPAGELVRAFGQHLFGRLAASHRHLLDDRRDSFDVLADVQSHIHQEVHKLYPDSEMPHFEITREARARMQMRYSSSRPFAALALGLIEGCLAFFGDSDAVSVEASMHADGCQATFMLTRAGT